MRKIDRFLQYLDRKGITENKATVDCSLSQGLLHQAKSGKSDLGYKTLDKIFDKYQDLNKEWLLTGEGEMLKSESVARRTDDKDGIPFYDINVTASITESFNDIPEEVQYFISYPPLNDCTAAFPVYGESMEPDFYAGEIILVKEIKNVDSMLWGEPYLIITNANCDNLRTIKNVYLSQDRTKFILRASNPRYAGDTIIDRSDVLKIFIVKGKLNRRQLLAKKIKTLVGVSYFEIKTLRRVWEFEIKIPWHYRGSDFSIISNARSMNTRYDIPCLSV